MTAARTGMLVLVAALAASAPSRAAAGDLHAPHAKARGGCAACHAVAPKGEGEWRTIGHDTCAPCHKELGERPLPGGKALERPVCAPCHPSAAPRAAGRPGPAIVYPHAAHKASADCARCHVVAGAGVSLSATMYACVTCHEAEGRRMGCRTCHAKAPTGAAAAAPARQGLSALLPKAAIPGTGHGPGWGRGHAKVAAARAAVCRECHEDKACAACHLGANRRLAYHPADWNAVHGIAAKKKSTECGGCHAAQSFCAGCHQRTGAAPYGSTAARPRSGHPAGWSGPVKTGNHHAFAAQRDISVCASCHDEKGCTACHASKARGGKGHGPHAAGFKDNCGSLISRNVEGCLKCHVRGDLKRRCLPGVQILPRR